jgi:hypothetical protein
VKARRVMNKGLLPEKGARAQIDFKNGTLR